ncbi:MAG: hypothetical protein EPN92_12135 [Chitinophagaceae bacterium]|nr:MAG: hypothetical protein EPN92_12135 [Chitinophagaceae bacterium]
MPKKIFIAITMFFLISDLLSQTSGIPNGIIYKFASDSINNEAKKIILNELSESRKYSLFDKILYIGPQLWNRYKNIQSLNNITGGNIQIKMPQYDAAGNKTGDKNADAKLIQNTSDFVLLWNQVIYDISTDTIHIRKLSTKEIIYYWSVIFYDIEEPVFVIENKKYKVLIQLTGDKLKLFWIDELLP